MADVVHTRRARADLKRIWRYIALDSETAADRFNLAQAVQKTIQSVIVQIDIVAASQAIEANPQSPAQDRCF